MHSYYHFGNYRYDFVHSDWSISAKRIGVRARISNLVQLDQMISTVHITVEREQDVVDFLTYVMTNLQK